MKSIKILQLVAITLVITFTSCSKKGDENIFPEIRDIATFQGNTNSDIVIINTQGGPVTRLTDDAVSEWIQSSGTKKLLWVNVHQSQTKNPEKFTNANITFNQAKEFDNKSVSDLKTVIQYFKDKNKTVYILGVSFGAFMTQELIAQHGIDIADKYLIVVGRLDIDEDTWMPFSQGKGTGYVYDSNGNYTIQVSNPESTENSNMSKLAAGLGYNRYVTKLANISSLSKITYVYGDRDEQVGPLSQAEIQFLQDKGATVTLVANGNHSATIDATILTIKGKLNIN